MAFTKYSKLDAKAYAKQHFTGVWAANLTPFHANGEFDRSGYEANLDHWIRNLKLGGLFVGGKQAEYFSMSVAERKTLFELSVQAASNAGKRGEQATCGIVTSCTDTNINTVLELAHHSENIGADYIVVHSPVLHFGADTDEQIYAYYKYISDRTSIGIALWNHPDCGYVMSPQLCARIAELPNIVAIKYSVDRALYAELTRLAGDKIQVSTASEHEWMDNMEELGWKLYLCSTPPFLLQTAKDQRINEYTRLAFAGDFASARKISDSLEPARQAYQAARAKGKPQATSKYWQELLGQVGGYMRSPMLQLSEEEKARIREGFAQSGLK